MVKIDATFPIADNVHLEVIGDDEGLQVNVVAGDFVENRIAISEDRGEVKLYLWNQDNWSSVTPAQEVTLVKRRGE